MDLAEWELDKTAAYIVNCKHRVVALQFPDELLHVAARVSSALTAACTGTKFYILGDTTFGSCCTDEVAAAHMNADLIVHYGHACLAPTSRLPAYFVFGRRALDPVLCARALAQCLPGPLGGEAVLLWDPDCSHGISSILASVAEGLGRPHAPAPPVQESLPGGGAALSWGVSPHPGLALPTLPLNLLPQAESGAGVDDGSLLTVCGFRYGVPSSPPPSSPRHVVYIGTRPARARLLLARFAMDRVTQVHPGTGEAEELTRQGSKLMAARYRCVEVVRASACVGLVAGTLGVARHTVLLDRLRAALGASGKACYTLLVGKPTPTKLGNFPELDCFVLVACPEGGVPSEEDARSYPSLLVTPHEALVALAEAEEEGGGAGMAWTGRAVVDIAALAGAGPPGVRRPPRASPPSDRPVHSLLTGRMAQPTLWQGEVPDREGGEGEAEQEVDEVDEGGADRGGTLTTPPRRPAGSSTVLFVAGQPSAGAAYLATRREWRGLQYDAHARGGEAGAVAVQRGDTGTAKGYAAEGGRR